jgi:hypothetical protein
MLTTGRRIREMAKREWFIGPTQVHGAPPKAQLVGCSIVRDGNTFEFRGPGPLFQVEATTSGDGRPPQAPFQFPRFTSALNGTVSRDWYINVTRVDVGPGFSQTDGAWSNVHFPGEARIDSPDEEPDTWTAQAGTGVGDDEGDDEEAASASSSY